MGTFRWATDPLLHAGWGAPALGVAANSSQSSCIKAPLAGRLNSSRNRSSHGSLPRRGCFPSGAGLADPRPRLQGEEPGAAQAGGVRGRRRVTGCLGSRRTWVFSSVPPLPKLLLRASASLAVKRWMTRQGLCSSSLRSLGWEMASGTSVWSSRVFCLLCMHPGPGLQTGPWLAVLQGPGSPVCPLSRDSEQLALAPWGSGVGAVL